MQAWLGKTRWLCGSVVPKERRRKRRYAAEVTAPILTGLRNISASPIRTKKADQVAIPNTAGFGAMENVGMVTYDQTLILADPKVDQIGRQRSYRQRCRARTRASVFGDW